MCFHKAACHIALSLGAFLVFSPPSLAQTAQSTPETVLTTFRVKPAQLSAFPSGATWDPFGSGKTCVFH